MNALWAFMRAHPSVNISIVLNSHFDTCFTHGKYREEAVVGVSVHAP